jgi:acyl carrier protein phosphodiesterase
MESITAFLDAHPQVRTALRVFMYSFLSVFALTLVDFLNEVREWAEGDDLPFPEVSTLAKAAAAAAAGALSAAFAVVWNKLPITKSSVYVPPGPVIPPVDPDVPPPVDPIAPPPVNG